MKKEEEEKRNCVSFMRAIKRDENQSSERNIFSSFLDVYELFANIVGFLHTASCPDLAVVSFFIQLPPYSVALSPAHLQVPL